ncbi:hypothetical protein E2C01_017319 [Portunus trituberculatus]|uniref:Uncharacterized protein n=1 Tax=Portunus trituberculatus TaxID=210409 RepID=A0A5B7DRL0_PORTR|nr:hypothetical protein [Portunus trituberculatus]
MVTRATTTTTITSTTTTTTAQRPPHFTLSSGRLIESHAAGTNVMLVKSVASGVAVTAVNCDEPASGREQTHAPSDHGGADLPPREKINCGILYLLSRQTGLTHPLFVHFGHQDSQRPGAENQIARCIHTHISERSGATTQITIRLLLANLRCRDPVPGILYDYPRMK